MTDTLSPDRERDAKIAMLPCPFCGGDARLSRTQDESLWSHAIVWYSQVSCVECEATRGDECDDEDGHKAISAWNERAVLTEGTNG